MERTNSRRRKAKGIEASSPADISLMVELTPPRDQSTTAGKPPSWLPNTACYVVVLLIFVLLAAFLFASIEGRPWIKGQNTTTTETHGKEQHHGGIGMVLHPESHVSRPPATLCFDWRVTKAFRSPDGVRKEVYVINDQFPGPTVEARSGDQIIVNVTNLLHDEGLAIHWHGLRMNDANDMDGAVGLTQAPIQTGESFLYNFTIGHDEFGTFWYHGHEKTQRDDGLYGGFIVHRPVEQSDEKEVYDYAQEVLLLVGDWYHRPSTEVLSWYMNSRSFGNEPVPDSLLINGHGNFDCDMAVPARPVQCIPPAARDDLPSLRFDHSHSYRLRLVNTGSLTGFSLKIDAASLYPFQVDGGNSIDMAGAQSIGIVYPGERVDAILLLHSSNSRRELTIDMDDENFKYPNPALTPMQTFPITPSFNDGGGTKSLPPTLDYYNLQAAVFSSGSLDEVMEEPLKFVIYTTTMKLAKHHNIPMGFINHTSWSPQAEPLISLPRTQYDRNQLAPHIALCQKENETAACNEWVEVVINNLDDGGHPFHLHGHSFYVVSVFPPPITWSSEKPPFTPGGSGMYNYNPFTTTSAVSPAGSYNLANPVMKDTVFVPQRGYAVIRFRANNKGIWMMHCHVGWHLGSGMAMSWDVS
ncbi:hypothetical protein A1O7_03113 [Cladophialophora yegresii CBS 114405]|uniref:L-ascorbate oxidase n=1 Tax=Cladophialophora yegresii CBS 114405 TaxID=1182544 RepID=W9WCF7_9EURO|nr:uncharacterized protein A1O7_03113 [Cladophialophora yegresii CBS 114405]EXJ62675.1 hypothetical protein A1O7_03113 [Cladophialophora yegresii CBS 114405]